MNSKIDELIDELNTYKQGYFREKKARQIAEEIFEDRTRELYLANLTLENQYKELEKRAAELELFLSLSRFSQNKFTFIKAMKFFLEVVCKLGNWPVGHIYVPEEENSSKLSSLGVWYLQDDQKYAKLKIVTTNLTLKKGQGLPGRVLESEEPIWIHNVEEDPTFLRKRVCEDTGLKGSFAIPIKCYGKVIAIAEFFSSVLEKDDSVLKLVKNFNQQFETLLERQKAEGQAKRNNIALQNALTELQQLAHYDTLTGLPNRRQFDRKLQQELEHAKASNYNFSLLYIDLDYFKNVNDTLGHAIGDLLLQEVSLRLKKCVREDDFIGRIGGDEFVFIGKVSTDKSINVIAHKIVKSLSKPYKIHQHDISISASVGISTYPIDGENVEDLCKNADVAMYTSKETGRNKYIYYNNNLKNKFNRKFDLENLISYALAKDEFYLMYQPIFQVNSQEMVGIEVLLRWESPTLGSIPPEEFIPVAEKKNIITNIGYWVLKTACEQYKKWLNTCDLKCNLLINISIHQLNDVNFFEKIVQILAQTQMSPERLEFEITETAIMTDPLKHQKVLSELRRIGIKIAIDDFGTGYSSLNRIKQIPFNTLKIDKSFIKDIGRNVNNDLIIQSIITLAKNLKVSIIAEGVEKESQMQFLKDHHCQNVQGFYYSHPLSVENLTKVFDNKENNKNVI